MATTASTARQYPLIAVADLRIANIGASNGITIAVPVNALVTNIAAHVVTAFDSATTTTITASDGTVTFISAEDAKAAAGSDIAVDAGTAPLFYPSGGTITFSMAETGATATVGRILGTVTYVIVGRQNENQF